MHKVAALQPAAREQEPRGRPVADREDSNSEVARVNTIDSRRDRLLSMVKTSRSSPGKHLASHIERRPVCLNVPCIFWVARN